MAYIWFPCSNFSIHLLNDLRFLDNVFFSLLQKNSYCNYCKYTFYQGSEITVFLFLFIKGVVPYHGQASGPTGRPGLSRHYGPPMSVPPGMPGRSAVVSIL
jgi:hypothetical protein